MVTSGISVIFSSEPFTEFSSFGNQVNASREDKILVDAQGQIAGRLAQVRGKTWILRQHLKGLVSAGRAGSTVSLGKMLEPIPIQKFLRSQPGGPPGADARPALVPLQAGGFGHRQFFTGSLLPR